MQQSELNTSAPGELISYGRKSYYNPDPLPPSRDLTLGNDFYETLSDATFWLGKLSGVSLELDFRQYSTPHSSARRPWNPLKLKGQILTTTRSTASETRTFDAGEDEISSTSTPGQTKDTQEVLNYEDAIENGIEALDRGEDLTVEQMHAFHETLLTGVPDDHIDTDTIGAYKTKPNHIGDFLPPFQTRLTA